MSRRASLPGAAELFRTTSAAEPGRQPASIPHPGAGAVPAVLGARVADSVRPHSEVPTGSRGAQTRPRIQAVRDRAPSGRQRHDEKITVYCSPEELLDLESARFHLRAEHGLAVDRGRIVREALAVVLADLEAKGEASILVRRLREL